MEGLHFSYALPAFNTPEPVLLPFGINMDAVMKRRNRFDPKKPRSEESTQ